MHELSRDIENSIYCLEIFPNAKLHKEAEKIIDTKITAWLEERVDTYYPIAEHGNLDAKLTMHCRRILKDHLGLTNKSEMAEKEEDENMDVKTWCDHIKYVFSKSGQQNSWFFQDPNMNASFVADSWLICPICQQVRPEPIRPEQDKTQNALLNS